MYFIKLIYVYLYIFPQVTTDSPKMLHNGNIHGGQFAMAAVPNAVVSNHLTQQNGTSSTYQDANMNSHMSQAYQDVMNVVNYGAASKLGALLSDRSQVLISSSQKDLFQSALNAENLGKNESGSSKCLDEYSQALHIDLDDEDEDEDEGMFRIDEVYTEKMEEDVDDHPQGDFHSREKKKVANKHEAVSSQTVKEMDFVKCNGQLDFKKKSKFVATSPLERARSLLDGITNGGDSRRERFTANSKAHAASDDEDIYAGLDEEDEGLDSGFQSKVSGKTGEGWLPALQSVYRISGEGEQGVDLNKGTHPVTQSKTEKRRLSDPLGDSVVGKKQHYIPVKNRGFQSGSVHSSGGRQSNRNSDHLVPRMNHEEGFIQIGPAGDPNEESFEFSVTIVFAKNLDQVTTILLFLLI